jgi:flagellar biogenesis protein FliO
MYILAWFLIAVAGMFALVSLFAWAIMRQSSQVSRGEEESELYIMKQHNCGSENQ